MDNWFPLKLLGMDRYHEIYDTNVEKVLKYCQYQELEAWPDSTHSTC